MTKKLIVNADDYGLMSSVNKGIVQSYLNGIVTSTSVLINLASDDDIAGLKLITALETGIHLTLTAGRSILRQKDIPNLVDVNRNFYKRKSKNRPVDANGTVQFDTVPVDEIKREFISQIKLFLSNELTPSHLDTHHHIHMNDKVLEALISVALDYNLPIRSINPDMCKKIKAAGVRTNDFFIGEFFGADNITIENLKSILSELNDGVSELMCHPGYLTNRLKVISGYSNERPIEMEVLTSGEAVESAKSMDIELITWSDVML